MTQATEAKGQSVGLFPKFFQAKFANRDLKIASGALASNNQNTKVPDLTASSGSSSFVSSPSVTASSKFVASANIPAAPAIVSNSAARNNPVNFEAQNTSSPNSSNTNFLSAPTGPDTTKALTAAPNVIFAPPAVAPAPVVARSATNVVSNPATVNTTPTVSANNQVAFNPPAVASSNSGDSTALRTTSFAASTNLAPIEQPAPTVARIQPTLLPQTFTAPLIEAAAPAPVLKAPAPQPPAPLPDPQPVLPLVIPPSVPDTGDNSQPSGGTSASKGDTSGGSSSGTTPPLQTTEAPPPPPPEGSNTNNIPSGGAGGGTDGLVGTYAFTATISQAGGAAAPLPVLERGEFTHVELTIEKVDTYFRVAMQIVNSNGDPDPTDHQGRAIRVFDHYKASFMDFYIQPGNRAEFTWADEPTFYAPGTKKPLWLFWVLPNDALSSALSFQPKPCGEFGCFPDPAWKQLVILEKPGYLFSADAKVTDFLTVTGEKSWISTIREESAQDSIVVPLTTDVITGTSLRATDKIFIPPDLD